MEEMRSVGAANRGDTRKSALPVPSKAGREANYLPMNVGRRWRKKKFEKLTAKSEKTY